MGRCTDRTKIRDEIDENSVCPNCNIEMVKVEITDEHINPFNKQIIVKDKRFQYYCTKCEHISFKH